MKIRKTTEKDIERVMDIYAYARKFMAEHGNPNQWGKRNWPPEREGEAPKLDFMNE
jgi:L-amino acid N-acyltransferase YncA